jgi:TPR repeat protein
MNGIFFLGDSLGNNVSKYRFFLNAINPYIAKHANSQKPFFGIDLKNSMITSWAYPVFNRIKICLILALLCIGTTSMAQHASGTYLVDGEGNAVKNSTGLCWHTSAWKPPTEGSEGDARLLSILSDEELPPNDVEQYQRALPGFLKAAERNDLGAMNALGIMYLRGAGVPQSRQTALSWFEKAASLGLADAQVNMGYMLIGENFYVDNSVSAENRSKALTWYLKAAEQGNAVAQYRASLLYYVELRDESRGLYWLEKSANQGYGTALFDVGIRYNGNANYITQKNSDPAEDIVTAYMYFTLAFNNGFVHKNQGRILARSTSDFDDFKITKEQIADANRRVSEWGRQHVINVDKACSNNGEAKTQDETLTADMKSVIQEIKTMVKTSEEKIPDFVVHYATPAQIDRLYSTPEINKSTTGFKEHGLIFAGQGGRTLAFDSPSDIINKVSRWFPEEMQAARMQTPMRTFGSMTLRGPYLNWKEEPAAFIVLWSCMPERAWLMPNQSPFLQPEGGFRGVALWQYDADFGQCVRGVDNGWYHWPPEERHRLEDSVEKTLQLKFANFLSTRACQGTGPDDCALVLLLWSSLSPSDPALATSIQTLETQLGLAVPSSEVQQAETGPLKPKKIHKQKRRQEEGNYAQGIRKEAFLRAKLASIINAPSAWPESALVGVFRQMALVDNELPAGIRAWGYSPAGKDGYGMTNSSDYYVDPWRLFTAELELNPRIQLAIATYLNTLDGEARCGELFYHASKDLQRNYIRHHPEQNWTADCK